MGSSILLIWATIPHDTFILGLSVYEGLKSSLSNLRSLELWISASYHGRLRLLGWENGIIRFISAAPALQSLVLYIDIVRQASKYSIDVIRSIAKPSPSIYTPDYSGSTSMTFYMNHSASDSYLAGRNFTFLLMAHDVSSEGKFIFLRAVHLAWIIAQV
jgi:hypothetical protein